MIFLIKTFIKLIIITIGTITSFSFLLIEISPFIYEAKTEGELTAIETSQKNMIEQFNNYKSGESFDFNLEEDMFNSAISDVVTSAKNGEGVLGELMGEQDLSIIELKSVYVEIDEDNFSFNAVVASPDSSFLNLRLRLNVDFEDMGTNENDLGKYTFQVKSGGISNVVIPLNSFQLNNEDIEEPFQDYISYNATTGNVELNKLDLVNSLKEDEDTLLIGTVLTTVFENNILSLSKEEKNLKIAIAIEKILVNNEVKIPEYLEGIDENLTAESVIATQLQSFIFSRVSNSSANFNLSEATLNRVIHAEAGGFSDLGFEVEEEKVGLANMWLEFDNNSLIISAMIQIGKHQSLIVAEYTQVINPNGDLTLAFKEATLGKDLSNNYLNLSKETISAVISMVGDGIPLAEIDENNNIILKLEKVQELLSSNESETTTITVNSLNLVSGGLDLDVTTSSEMDDLINDIDNELENIKDGINGSELISSEVKDAFEDFYNNKQDSSKVDELTKVLEKITEEEAKDILKIMEDLGIEFEL